MQQNFVKMKKEGKRKMYMIFGMLALVFGIALLWFHIPYSPVKREFNRDVKALIENTHNAGSKETFTENDFSHLPAVVQKYIEHCGYLGTQKMSYLRMEYHDVDFKQGKDTPAMKIDYTQFNFIREPARLALIDSSMFGVPFEGYDYYQKGDGGMKGLIGKALPLFHQKGTEMDKACLVTFLAESMFAPAILLQDYIELEQISDLEIKAAVTYNGQTASGIFTFNENYEMISFTTDDRAVVGADGTINHIPWSAICSRYKVSEHGIKYPTEFQAVWNYPDGDFVYFDGGISKVSYGFE